MIRIIGNQGCSRCSSVKRILEGKGIEFSYEFLNELNSSDRTKVMGMAKEVGQTTLPIIIKDDKIIDVKGVVA